MESTSGYQDLKTLRERKLLRNEDILNIFKQILIALTILSKQSPPLLHRGIRINSVFWDPNKKKLKIGGGDKIIEATDPHVDRLSGDDWTQVA